MSLQLFDTATRDVRAFAPRRAGEVGIYVCGATVQGPPHLGHLRSAVVFDQLRRWLTYLGYHVTVVRNVTDIDDKILDKAVVEGREWWAHAYLYEQKFTEVYDALGVARPTYEPRATGHITEMVELIDRLIAAGHAYPAADESGDVYFDSASWPAYGALTNQKVGDMEPAADAAQRGKKDPRDFALWKGTKAGEPETAAWPTPWGRGRPGWHVECSAMATRYLGAEFDIHGGGLDLRFPHHENELAQSNAAGDGFAAFWMHSGLLNIGGEKMSKSLGNSIFADDVIAEWGALPLRYLLGSAHYRSTLDYSPETLSASVPAIEKIARFLTEAQRVLGVDAAADSVDGHSVDRGSVDGHSGTAVPEAFADAMNNDLAVPQALAVVFSRVGDGNRILAGDRTADSREELRAAYAQTRLMLGILGIDPLDEHWAAAAGDDATKGALDELVKALIDQRAHARAQKDFATADAVRDNLAAAGIELIDTPDGTRYHVKE